MPSKKSARPKAVTLHPQRKQAQKLFYQSKLFGASMSRHQAKQIARQRLSEAGLPLTFRNIAKETPITNQHRTGAKYIDIAASLLHFCQIEGFAVKFHQIQPEHVLAFLNSKKFTTQKSVSGVASALMKLDIALSRTSDSHMSFESVVSSFVKESKKLLPTQGRQRRYDDPETLIARLNGDFRIVAELQYRAGLRISGATGTYTLNPEKTGYRGVKASDLVGNILYVTEKGFKKRGIEIRDSAFLEQLRARLSASDLLVDPRNYRYQLMKAAKETGQPYDGSSSHGLRWNYAHNRFGELLRDGIDNNEALLTVSRELGHERIEATKLYLRRR